MCLYLIYRQQHGYDFSFVFPSWILIEFYNVTYKVRKKLVPDYLSEIFTNVNQIHDHTTRQSQLNFALPKPKTSFIKNKFG